MKILVNGNPPLVRLKKMKFGCNFCNCVFLADKGEYEVRKKERSPDGYSIVICDCPCCYMQVEKRISNKELRLYEVQGSKC